MKIDCLFLSLFLSEFVCGIFKIVECNFVDNILYYKPTIGTFEVWTYILLDWLILQGLCILGCFVLFLCIIGFTCLRFCVRVLLDCRLDFLEPLPGNQFVRVYVAFSLFLIGFCFGWISSDEMKMQNSIGQRVFVGYMIRVGVFILRRYISIIFIGESRSWIIHTCFFDKFNFINFAVFLFHLWLFVSFLSLSFI